MLRIFWFRKDLRLTDNRGLAEFLKKVSVDDNLLFLYVKNKNTYNYFGEKRIGFLYESLIQLKEELLSIGFNLRVVEGKSTDVFRELLKNYNRIEVYCNLQVEPYCFGRDNEIKELFEESGSVLNSFSDSTIFKPGEIKNGEGRQYKVFTPFKNQCLNVLDDSHYRKIDYDFASLNPHSEIDLKGFNQISIDKEYKRISSSAIIKGGRKEGLGLLKKFYENGIEEYRSKRDTPSVNGTSFLSAHLHFGTVGIREAFRTAFYKLKKIKEENTKSEVSTWINELLWREFYYNIAFHNPEIMFESFKKEYDNLKWSYDEETFQKWCEGKTGFPIVDAGMRQLNKEGWMHNRVRMITAMFLTKDLFIDWRWGERYFAEKLIDMDFANNNGGWQWSASTGVDSQPYFRIFNPYLQSKKYDPDGIYIRKYLPELSPVPDKYIHEPNQMTINEQKSCKVIIGEDYPEPLVDHSKIRAEVIKKFKEVSGAIQS